MTVEEWLQRHVEDPGAPALRRVLGGGWPPGEADRSVVATYVAFQLLRTPLIREYMLQIDRVTAPLLWSAAVLKPESTVDLGNLFAILIFAGVGGAAG